MDKYSTEFQESIVNNEINIDSGIYKTFRCKPKEKQVTWVRCMEDFVNVNAREQQLDACYDCKFGEAIRNKYAGS